MSTAQAPPHYNDIPSKDVKYPTKSYGATPQDTSANEPLLGAHASSSRGDTSNAWMDQSDDDIPDDFKVGVAVIDCDTEIRMAFIRKVYSILFVQLLLTSLVSLGLYHPKAVEFQQQHPWTIFIPMVGSFVSLLGVYWKRHQHPANLVILGIFTMFEAMLVGTITSYYESKIVSYQSRFVFPSLLSGTTSPIHHSRSVHRSDPFHIPDQGKLNVSVGCPKAYQPVGLQLPRPFPVCRIDGYRHDILCPDLPPIQRQHGSLHRVLLGSHLFGFRPLRHSTDHETAQR